MKLYNRATAKFHHMYHLHDSVVRFRRVLSCFPTERKHRETKKAALHVFRNMEATVIKDIVNRTCENYSGDDSLFQQSYLVTPQNKDVHGVMLKASRHAIVQCGSIKAGDIVFLSSNPVSLGQVESFYEFRNDIYLNLKLFRMLNNDRRFWTTDGATPSFVLASLIVDAVAWRQESPAIIRVIPPFFV